MHMTQFKGFETKQEAQTFARQHGGYICWEERTPKTKKLTNRGRYYTMAVTLGGLDQKKYPYCVQWVG